MSEGVSGQFRRVFFTWTGFGLVRLVKLVQGVHEGYQATKNNWPSVARGKASAGWRTSWKKDLEDL